MLKPYISSTQVASSVPFDNVGQSFDATDVQAALLEVHAHRVFDPEFVTTSASGTLTLTTTNKTLQILSGSATGYTVKMPNATALYLGEEYYIANTGSQPISVVDNTGAALFTLSQNAIGFMILQAKGSAAGTWIYWQSSVGVANGIITYNVTSSTAFTTSSQSDVVITGFTATPQAGTYAVWYNAESFYTTTPKTHWWSIYKAGVQIPDSLRFQDTAHSSQNMADSTMTIIQFDGTQACDVRVRCDTSGSLTVNQRSLLLIRLGT